MRHEVTADHLVVEIPLLEDFMVEEVAERPVADVMEQARDAERFLDERR